MKNMGLLFSLLAILMISCSKDGAGKNPPGSGKEKVETKEPEMKWAKEIADLFLAELAAAKFDFASRLVVKARQNPGPGSLVSSTLRDEMGAIEKYAPGDEFTSWTFTSILLSPSKDEASFKGTMEGPKRSATFSLRVIKEKSDDKWRVEAFSAKVKKKTDKE